MPEVSSAPAVQTALRGVRRLRQTNPSRCIASPWARCSEEVHPGVLADVQHALFWEMISLRCLVAGLKISRHQSLVYITLESLGAKEDVALEWETAKGFCFRMSIRSARILAERLNRTLQSRGEKGSRGLKKGGKTRLRQASCERRTSAS